MELGNELIPIVFWHAHKCATHNDELDLYIQRFQVKVTAQEKGAPYQRYGLNSLVVPCDLVSARMDHTVHEWRACSLARTPCNFVCCNQNRSRGRRDSNYTEVNNGDTMRWNIARRTRICSLSLQCADTGEACTSQRLLLSGTASVDPIFSRRNRPTPLAVRTGLAFSLGNKAFL